MDNGKKILNLSGAATKIPGLLGASDYIYNVLNYRPTDITGISSGALLSLPIAMRKWDLLRDVVLNFTLDDIFDNPPVNEKNNLTFKAKLRALFGKPSFGTQRNIYKTIQEIISRDDFDRYKKGDYPNVWIGCVNFIDGSRFVVNIKDKSISYDDYLLIVNASASIPLAVEPVIFKDKILFDGGVRNHILSTWVLKNLDNINEMISVFSRPKEYMNILDKQWFPKNILSVFGRTTDIQVIETSKRDEKEENLMIELIEKKEKRKIKHSQVFVPYIIKELYDTNPVKLRKLYNAGFKSASNILSNWE